MKKLAIFDFDGTLFTEETIPFLLKNYSKLGYSRIRQTGVFLKLMVLLTKYKLGSMDKEAFRGRATIIYLDLVKHMTTEQAKKYFEENIEAIMQYLNPAIVSEIESKRREGYELILLSGCFMDILEPLRKQLVLDIALGTVLHYKEDNGLDLSQDISIISGANKALRLKGYLQNQLIDWDNSYAYGDSYYDYEILSMVGNPIAVRPDDKLLKIAQSKSWRII